MNGIVCSKVKTQDKTPHYTICTDGEYVVCISKEYCFPFVLSCSVRGVICTIIHFWARPCTFEKPKDLFEIYVIDARRSKNAQVLIYLPFVIIIKYTTTLLNTQWLQKNPYLATWNIFNRTRSDGLMYWWMSEDEACKFVAKI